MEENAAEAKSPSTKKEGWKMKKNGIFAIILASVALLSLVPAAMAHTAAELEQAKAIIDAGTPCSELTDEQLELIGDYYMEQIHPGEQHEAMDAMMGGEGSESLAQMHVAMAYRFYCSDLSEEANQYYGMMGSGYGGGMMGGMMGSGMMGGYGGMMDSGYGPGMMYGGYGNNSTLGTLGAVNSVLFTLALIAFIVFIGIKIYREVQGGKKK